MLTRVFGRLSAWQNWIFNRPNAVGEHGALKVYGTGQKAGFDMNRVSLPVPLAGSRMHIFHRHSRESGNPWAFPASLDSRFRGNDEEIG
jgi:hypothetical protein